MQHDLTAVFNNVITLAKVSGKKNCRSYCMQMTWGYWQDRRVVTEKSGGKEALDNKVLKVNAKKTKVMVCTREVSRSR